MHSLLDLHGLSVRDAKVIVKTTISETERMNRQSEDWSEVHFIVGLWSLARVSLFWVLVRQRAAYPS
jgi:hypothetical protein